MSDTIPHINLEMTLERKERWKRVGAQIVDLLEKETKPVEALAILDLVRDAINQRFFLGDYKGSHLISTTKRAKESVCPGCATKLDAIADAEGHSPEAGDASVCATCGEILIFTDQLTLVRPNATQLALIRTDGRVMAMVAAIQSARKHREALKEKLEKA